MKIIDSEHHGRIPKPFLPKSLLGEKIPIKIWSDEIENSALKQVKNLANFPFAFHHIAIMPDVHMGFGMPIGGVLATKGVVVPNAVGCFTGDIKISLLDGMQKTLKELFEEGNEVYVYSLDKNLKLVTGKAKPKLTRKNAELIEVFISGGEKIRCTPDHKFMLLDGSYKEAKNLKMFDSLMPLYKSYQSRDGYERIRTFSGNGILTHKMVAKQFLTKKNDSEIIHHKDNNWYNNEPSNLEYVDAKLHSKNHRKSNPVFGTIEFKRKRLARLQENSFYDKKFTEKKKEVAIKNINKYNQSNKKKEQDKLAGKRGRKYLIEYNKQKNNHKVLFVNKLNYKEDVYCLTVEKYHNFALASGIFVHNCDIGCGMVAVKTPLKTDDLSIELFKKIIGQVRQAVPVGFKHHKFPKGKLFADFTPKGVHQGDASTSSRPRNIFQKKMFTGGKIINEEWDSAKNQLGTLGGGNHFIEFQKDDKKNIWIMIHSGSRNLGFKVAKYYNEVAKKMNEKSSVKIPVEWDLAFLSIDSKEGKDYLNEMNYCVDFAYENRKLMMELVIGVFVDVFKKNNIKLLKKDFSKLINVGHNYARVEKHFGEQVVVHRKGATSAKKGEFGIIPGSQGSASYIVKGKGNFDSFMSCSHGAGRKMSRKGAREKLSLEKEKMKLEKLGIIHGIRNKKDLDEATGAYKDIEGVMDNQKDLIEIVERLVPIGVIKG